MTTSNILPQTVLVVDDQAADRRACTDPLLDAGYRVEQASNGTDALDVLEHGVVDLVLADWQMPLLCGQDLLQLFRIRWPRVALVVMTAFSSEERAVASVEWADGYLRKPFSDGELTSMVARALEARRRLSIGVPPEQETRGGVTIDRHRCEARFGDGPLVPLTVTEYRVLNHLFCRAGELVKYLELAEAVVERKLETRHEAADICKHHLHALRRKLESDPRKPQHLKRRVKGEG